MTADSHLPADVFDEVASEVRIDIIRALAAARHEMIADQEFPAREDLPLTVTFSELFERVGIEDSGRFNYHLQELLGSYVAKTDEGTYRLTVAGREMAGSILSGVYAGETRGPTEVESDCTRCGGELMAEYRDGRVLVRCADDHRMLSAFLPTGAVKGRPMPEVLETAAMRLRHEFEMIRYGICPWCYGTMVVSIGPTDLVKGDDYGVEAACQRCGQLYAGDFELYLIHDDAVRAFLREHDVDTQDIYPWELRGLADDRLVTEASESGGVRYRLGIDGESLRLRVTETGKIDDVSISTA